MSYYLRNLYIRRALVAILADAACFGLAATLTWLVVHPPFAVLEYAITAACGAVLVVVAMSYCDAYGPTVLGCARRTFSSVTSSMGMAFVVALGVYWLVDLPPGATQAMAHTAAFFFPLLLVERAGFRAFSTRCAERVIVIGASELGIAVAQAIHERPNMGIELVGFLSDGDFLRGDSLEGFPVLGRVSEIEKLVDELQIGRIVVASKNRDEHFPAEQLLAAKLRGCRVDSGVHFCERTTGLIFLGNLRSSYLIFSEGFRSGALSNALRRCGDIVVATALLTLASSVLVLAALAIRLDSPGPVFYWQERVGKDGRVYRIVKLRSMTDGAEEETGVVLARSQDKRITRIGRLLRATRLDEVPQFWNVLRGEMSIVGPRPERPELVEILTERYPLFRWRCAVKPGITGWAQIRHGYVNEIEDFEHKLSLDLFYMKYRSFGLDLLILWETIKTVVLLRGL